MTVYDLHDEQGRLRAFEIDNASISRSGVIRVLKSIPGLVVNRSHPWYRRNFCDFELGGSTFRASDPSDERSRFLLSPSSAGYSQQIDIVKSAFLRHSPPRWIPTTRVLSYVLMMSGALGFTLPPVVERSAPGTGMVMFLSGGLILVGLLLMVCNFLRAR
jgi:hypothetical protein